MREQAMSAEAPHTRLVLAPEHTARADFHVLAKVTVPAQTHTTVSMHIQRNKQHTRGPQGWNADVGGRTCGVTRWVLAYPQDASQFPPASPFHVQVTSPWRKLQHLENEFASAVNQ